MKLKKITTITLLIIGGLATPILAENVEQLRQFLDNSLAVCQGCDLSGADLSNIKRRGAKLRQTNLKNADLSNSNFSSSYFTCADLTDANLRNTNLQWSNLVDANLRGVDLRGADLSKTDLSGAIFEGASTEGVILEGAKMPDGATIYDGRGLESFQPRPIFFSTKSSMFRRPKIIISRAFTNFLVERGNT